MDHLRWPPVLGEPVVLLHLVKTAGTSVARGVAQALGREHVILGFDQSCFGTFDGFDTFSPEIRALIRLDGDPLPRPDFASGHLALSTIRRRLPKHRVFTIVREPRSRVLSLWLFWRALWDEQLPQFGSWADILRKARRPLADFLADPAVACLADNLYARALLWPHPLVPDGGPIPHEADAILLAEAAARLDGLDFVAPVEAPDLAARLGRWLGVPAHLGRENTTIPVLPEWQADLDEHLTEEATSLVADRTRLDRVLWERVAARVGLHAATTADDAFEATRRRHEMLLAGLPPATGTARCPPARWPGRPWPPCPRP